MKRIIALVIVSFILVTSFIPVNASYDSMNLELTLEVGDTEMLSGESNQVYLNLKTTGSQTHFTDSRIEIKADHQSLVFDLDYLLENYSHQFDAIKVDDKGTLILEKNSLQSGVYYELPIPFKTNNGLVANDSKLSFTAQFTSKEYSSEVVASEAVSVYASSPSKINKKYFGLSPEYKTGQAAFFGSSSYWETKALISKSLAGQEFIKEDALITIIETYDEHLVYESMQKGPEPTVDLANRTLTWTFQAPTYVEQDNATDNLWLEDLVVKYGTIDAPNNNQPVKGVETSVTISYTSISGNVHTDQSSDSTTLYPSGIATPELNGLWNVFGHWGPTNAQGDFGYKGYDDMNMKPTVYPWGELGFAHRISSMYGGKYSGYHEYLFNYLIDESLILKTLSLPLEWVNFPDAINGSKPLRDFPEYDIYLLKNKVELDVKGNNDIDERDIIAKLVFGVDFNHGDVIDIEEVLSSRGYDKDTYIAQVRYDFSYAPGGAFNHTGAEGSNMFRYKFAISNQWDQSSRYNETNDTTEVSNEITIYDKPIIDSSYHNPNFSIDYTSEIWDFRENTINGTNACSDKVTPGKGWWPENGITISCMNILYREKADSVRPNGFGNSFFWDVNGFRTAYITNDTGIQIPTVSNTIELLDHTRGTVYSGDNTLQINVNNIKNLSQGTAEHNGLKSYISIPSDMELDLNDIEVIQGDLNVEDIIITYITTNGNYKYYEIDWNLNSLLPGNSIQVNLGVNVGKKYQDLNLTINTDIPNDEFEILSVTEPKITDTIRVLDLQNFTKKGVEYEMIQSKNNYQVISDYYSAVEKSVKGSLDTTFSALGHNDLTGSATYNFSIENKEGRDISEFALMDVLPNVGDTGITDGFSRGSEFNILLEGPIQVHSKFEVFYSEQVNPSKKVLNEILVKDGFNLIDDSKAETNTQWISEDEVTSWSDIHSFIIVLKEGQVFENGELFSFHFKALVDQDSLEGLLTENYNLVAWNSFALAMNGKPSIEPLQVGLVLKDPTEPEVPVEPEIPVEPEKPTDPEKPVEPEIPTIPVEPIEPPKPEDNVKPEIPKQPKPGNKLPSTGVSDSLAPLAGAVLILMGVVIRNKKKDSKNNNPKS